MKTLQFTGLVIGLLASVYTGNALARPHAPICPMVYKPAVCSYQNYSAGGSNSCFASAALQAQLQSHGIDASIADFTCASSELVMKAAKPVCGIVYTETECSVTVGDNILTASAQSCDSPIPELMERLKDEGVNPNGLTAECVRIQSAGETPFSVTLQSQN